MGKSICNKCGAIEDDMDAGFSPAAHGMMHECGGKWVDYAAYLMGKKKTEKKSASSRENGKKGGRPGKNKYWVVMCSDGHGWEAVYDGLWGYKTRIYRTKKEAETHMRELKNDKCWRDTNFKCDHNDDSYDPSYNWKDDIPEFFIQQMMAEEIESDYFLSLDLKKIS